MKYKYGIFIGRFSPIHLGHYSIINQAFEKAERLIIVLGSHNVSRSINNPWTTDEREDMIFKTLTEEQKKRVYFVRLRDHLYNTTLWVADAQNKIDEIVEDVPDEEIALFGYKSDKSSNYIDLFPNWTFISCPTTFDLHATNIRGMYFTYDIAWQKCVPEVIVDYLEDFQQSKTFGLLKDEYDYLADYRRQWSGSPFPPVFQTVDTCCIKSGHILLVRRGKSLGKGLLALPGGFLDSDEEIEESAIRELKEETAIKLSKEELRNHIVESKRFDYPYRSNRGRVITECFLIDLGAGKLDKVKGMDDADKAFWLPVSEALNRESEFFEDHYHIISYFINRL